MLQPSLMLGFKVWQTNLDDQFQNDAFIFGLGLDVSNGSYAFQTSFRGYCGYLDNGDFPLVWDTRIRRQFSSFDLFVGGGLGFRDNLYNRLEVGAGVYFAGGGGND